VYLAGEDRMVAKLPPIHGKGRLVQLEAAQAALAELCTYV